jgi:hypothetical protein
VPPVPIPHPKNRNLRVPDAGGGLKTAVLVQEPDGGPILSAATN